MATAAVPGGGPRHMIAIFRINPETGGLVVTTDAVNAPSPICLEF